MLGAGGSGAVMLEGFVLTLVRMALVGVGFALLGDAGLGLRAVVQLEAVYISICIQAIET